jgi:hypothetical protein
MVLEGGEEVVGDDELEDGITEELEPFVVGALAVLGDHRTVGERPTEEARIGESVPEGVLEAVLRRHGD